MANVVYNTNQDLDLDGKMMISLGGEPVAFATTAKLTLTTDMVDTTNMMSGDWKDEVPGIKSFALSTEALLTRKTGAISATTLMDAQLHDTLLDFVFGSYTRSGDDVTGYSYALDATKDSYKGKARITSMELNGESSKLKKYSMSANGCGPLTKVAGTVA